MERFLLKWSFTHKIWNAVFNWFGCSWVLPNSLPVLFEAWSNPSMVPRGREMWKLSFLAVLWIFWKERNAGCFEGIVSSVNLVSDKIKLSVAFWLSTNPLFHGFSLDQVMLNWKEVAESY